MTSKIRKRQYHEHEQLIEPIKNSVKTQSVTLPSNTWNEHYRQLSYFATIYLPDDVQFLCILSSF